MRVSQIVQLPGQGQKAVNVGMEKLGHDWHRHIFCGLQVAKLFGVKVGMGLGVNKRGHGLVDAAKVALKQVAKKAVGDSANRRQVEKGLSGRFPGCWVVCLCCLLSHEAKPPVSRIRPGPGWV